MVRVLAWRLTWPRRNVWCIGGLLVIWLLFNIERTDLPLLFSHTYTEPEPENQTSYQRGFVVNTKGCRIPDLDPLDPSIRDFIHDKPLVECSRYYGPALLESNLTSIYVVESALGHYNINDINSLHCCFKPFYRITDDAVKFLEECIPVVNVTIVNYEFVRAECSLQNKSIYVDYHAFVPSATNISLQAVDAVSVLVIGVDAVSRLNLHRQMPQTVTFLKEKLSAIEMLGYNKVGDNTFPNLMPVLAGLSEKELIKTCWPTSKSVFDKCNFIWDHFKSAKYITAFGEDATEMGIFNFLKEGFIKQPTDYDWRTFAKVSEDEIGSNKTFNAKLCVGPRKSLDNLLSYVIKFVMTMKNVLSFGVFWGVSLSHDSLNLPRQGDVDHRKMLETLNDQGVFNKTVLIFMSDHGIRWGGIRKTYQGYLEERLPVLFIVCPKWFQAKYNTATYNLKQNAEKLITPFDLHEFLLDLLDVSTIKEDSLKVRTSELLVEDFVPRGISLFLPIPVERSCQDAGIVDHWCTCHQSTYVSERSNEAQMYAKFVIKYINALLEEYPQCANLSLSRVLSAREELATSHKSFSTSDAGFRFFLLTLETTPGGAQFEATVRFNGNTNKYSIMGTVSRINRYKDQSKCITQYSLRLYCYCNFWFESQNMTSGKYKA